MLVVAEHSLLCQGEGKQYKGVHPTEGHLKLFSGITQKILHLWPLEHVKNKTLVEKLPGDKQ